nr:acetylxylan esterase [bacterium]
MKPSQQIQSLALPDVLGGADTPAAWAARRQDIIALLQREVYGGLPPKPCGMQARVLEENHDYCAGKALYMRVELACSLGADTFAFPITCVLPKGNGPHPAFVYIGFRPDVPDRLLPSEEILDGGFAVLSFHYQDVAPDRVGGCMEGLGHILYPDGTRGAHAGGTIAMWAWAAMRVMDFAQSLDMLDKGRIAVVGHSRLGKTALLAGALDERFCCAISNESGCSGAAITREKQGERVKEITDSFPHWFCPAYAAWAGREGDMPFDQHFLLALMAPRRVYVASAAGDAWADPRAEYASCLAAGPVFRLLGGQGLVAPDRWPRVGTQLHGGDIAYHLRAGTHHLSRLDWQKFMAYMRRIPSRG